MAIATTTEKNSLATKYATDGLYGSLHSASPGTTGASEISGGTPAYARQSLIWSAANNGAVSATATFDVPSGVTVAYAGIWSAATLGNFLDSVSVTSQTFASQGTFQVTYTFTVT